MPQIPQNPPAYQQNFDILGSLSASQPPSQSSTPTPGFPQFQNATATPPPPPADPFASLVSPSPRQPSPLPSAASPSPRPPASSSLLDFAGAEPKGKAPEDDEWNFTSSLPESSALPNQNRVQVLSSSLKVEFVARRHPQQQRQIHIVARFSNGTSQALNDLHFQVAVEKVPLWLPASNGLKC
jgi:hypothetical protein